MDKLICIFAYEQQTGYNGTCMLMICICYYRRKTNTYLMMKTVTAELTTDEAQTVPNKQPTLQLLPSPQ